MLQEVELQIVDIRRQLAGKERSVQRQAAKLRATEEALASADAGDGSDGGLLRLGVLLNGRPLDPSAYLLGG